MKSKIVKEGVCESCGGTGLYRGLAESGTLAVQCHMCEGSGRRTYQLVWEDFKSRKEIPNVTLVIECGTSYGLDEKIAKAGIPYKEWLKGHSFTRGTEPREWMCPKHYIQTTGKYHGRFTCDALCGGSFVSCKHFENKAKCWEDFDKQLKGYTE